MNFGFGCCVSSEDKVARYVRPYVGARPCIEIIGATSISRAYNFVLDCWAGDGFDAVVLLHDDLEVIDPEADFKIKAALAEPDVALVGIAGGNSRAGLSWWAADPIGHQLIDTGMIDFGLRDGDVVSLEGSFMVFSPWAVQHLRFDERFGGFHGYDHIGVLARDRGKRVLVRDIDTHHHTVTGFKTPESEAAWHAADRLFKELYL